MSSNFPSSEPPQASSSQTRSSQYSLDIESSATELLVKRLMGDTFAGSNKRKGINDSEEDENEATRVDSSASYGRTYGRQGDIFTSTDAIVQLGITAATAIDDDCEWSDKEERDLQSWEQLCTLIPCFREMMLGLANKRPIRRGICKKIDKGMHDVRAEDTNSLKSRILNYLLEDPKDVLTPPILAAGNKADRGLRHPVTAKLICPLKFLPTAETYADIEASVKHMTATALPRFLYPENQAYNPDDIEDGLLRGHVLIRVCKHILQGPGAALERPGFHRGRRGNAALMNLTSVTPRIIAYAAVQTRFALSSQDHWSIVDGMFNYEDFFWNIVGLFDDGEGQEIINLYNYHVFGHAEEQGAMTAGRVAEDGPSDLDIIKAQRRAKKARHSI